MYEVVSIDEALRTSFIKLKNCETGTIDECFDDSSVGCDNNFCFMKVGDMYDCKIELVEDVVPTMQEGAALCKVIARDVMVGKTNMVKVLVGGDIYYLPQYKISNLAEGEFFYYDASVHQILSNFTLNLSKFPSAALSSIDVATATPHSSALQTENLSCV